MMCWPRRRRWDARRWKWRAPSSATPRPLSRNPRSERANVAYSCGNLVHRRFGPAGGSAAATGAEPLGGSEMRLETEQPPRQPGHGVFEERDDGQVRGSKEERSERRAAGVDPGADDRGAGEESRSVVLPRPLLRHDWRRARDRFGVHEG